MAYFSPSATRELLCSSPLESQTSVEILRIDRCKATGNGVTDLHAVFGDEVIDYITVDSRRPMTVGCVNASLAERGVDTDTLQLLFVNSTLDNGYPSNRLQVTEPTLGRMCDILPLQYAFMEAILIRSIWSKQSGGTFHKYDDDGEVIGIYGFYHYFNDWDSGPLHVWFSYDTKFKLTTYLLIDCPKLVKERIITMANGPIDSFLHRPFAIDFVISEQCAIWKEKFINKNWKQLFEWRDQTSKLDQPIKPNINTLPGLRGLHNLSRTWNMIYEDLGDFEERCDLLIEAAKKLQFQNIQPGIESFQFLKSRNRLRRRWVASFAEQTKLIINFVFSQATQENGQTNLDIADLTATIAKETQQDNSSMITIATMTMLFLPGTFVSAIFSMVFFNYGTDSSGRDSLTISPLVWLFPTLTVPLTIIVFMSYRYWRNRREKKVLPKSRESSNVDLEREERRITEH